MTLTEFEKEIDALLKATLEQQPGWHEAMKPPGDLPMSPKANIRVLEARVNAYRVVIFRLAREIATLKGE